ncbi:MAG: glycoside hydrolase family 127 protein [Lachnospiraceae bacterium]|nr:glycoside hydrolase family 127 protein [Lachnospiraceae bacterium]
MKKTIRPRKWKFYTTNEIKPSGYIRQQLEIQANGSSGHLHEFWRDIKDSKWIGGDAEGWERVPYWLDGFIPLAYLLDDEEKKRVAKKYIDAILARQDADGWICPCGKSERGGYDVWAYFLILKVLTVYYDCSGDGRITDAVYRALKALNRHVEEVPIFAWGQMRWYECLIPIYWLWERCEEEWLCDLVNKLHCQGFDYYSYYRNAGKTKKTEKGKWSQISHVVNNVMMLKADALYSLYNRNGSKEKRAEFLYRKLMNEHGTAVGTFTGDECLAGKEPVQGTELCSVAELMYSFEQLISITGKGVWADRLDKITFNALFATFSPDMWTHQYDQQVNQIMCAEVENPVYTTNSGDSNIFGLEPNFGCCTANLSQALPKYILSSFMKGENQIVVVNLSPCELHTAIKGKPVHIRVEGNYPFGDKVAIAVETEEKFTLAIRIPAWADAFLNGVCVQAENGFCELSVNGDKRIELELKTQPKAVKRGNGIVFERGALVYSFHPEEEWRQIHKDVAGREYPHCDYEVYPVSDWQFAIISDEAVFESDELKGRPFYPNETPVRLKVQGAEYPWELKDGCAYPAKNAEAGSERTLTLIPYGATNLRITEFPLIKKH